MFQHFGLPTIGVVDRKPWLPMGVFTACRGLYQVILVAFHMPASTFQRDSFIRNTASALFTRSPRWLLRHEVALRIHGGYLGMRTTARPWAGTVRRRWPWSRWRCSGGAIAPAARSLAIWARVRSPGGRPIASKALR